MPVLVAIRFLTRHPFFISTQLLSKGYGGESSDSSLSAHAPPGSGASSTASAHYISDTSSPPQQACYQPQPTHQQQQQAAVMPPAAPAAQSYAPPMSSYPAPQQQNVTYQMTSSLVKPEPVLADEFKFTAPLQPISQAMTQPYQALPGQGLPGQASAQQLQQQQQMTSFMAALNDNVNQGLLGQLGAEFGSQPMSLGEQQQSQQQQQSMIGLLQSSNPEHDAALQGLIQGAFDVMENPFTATNAMRKPQLFDAAAAGGGLIQQQQPQQQQLWSPAAPMATAAVGDAKGDVSNVIQNVNQGSANIFQALSALKYENGGGCATEFGGINANLNNSNRKVDNRDSPDSTRELSITSGDSPKCSSSQNSPTMVSDAS